MPDPHSGRLVLSGACPRSHGVHCGEGRLKAGERRSGLRAIFGWSGGLLGAGIAHRRRAGEGLAPVDRGAAARFTFFTLPLAFLFLSRLAGQLLPSLFALVLARFSWHVSS